MHFVRLIVISFILLFLVILGLSLFIPSHIRISKAINVKADRNKVMAQVKDVSNWKNWYPGLDTAKPLYEAGTLKGMILNDKDSQHLVYIAIQKEDSNEVTAQFVGKKMNPVINVWRIIENPSPDSLTLQWYMDFHLQWYPWEKFASMTLERSYGPRMEQGLSTIKKLVEN